MPRSMVPPLPLIMILDRKEIVLVHDQTVNKYTAPWDIHNSWPSPSSQSGNTSETNKSNCQIYKGRTGQLNGGGQSQLTKPTAFDPTLKRARGRPRVIKNLKRTGRKEPALIAPKSRAPDEVLAESDYQDLLQSGIYPQR